MNTATTAPAVVFVASGDDRQQAFACMEDAVQAAKFAPWADGRVFRHDCRPEDFSGFAEIGGEQVL